MSEPMVWIVGDVAWDTVVYLDHFPRPGTFTRARHRAERPGGSAGNVAHALATTGVRVGFVTELGRDEQGRMMHASLLASAIENVHVTWTDRDTQHLIVFVHDHGERTLVAIAGGGAPLDLEDVPLAQGDIVVFVAWDPQYKGALDLARESGCFTVVGLSAVEDPQVEHADMAFGSRSDLTRDFEPTHHLDRFGQIVVTRGSSGADHHGPDGIVHQAARPARIVDTTGAGDAFLSGYLSMLAQGEPPQRALDAGARWAAAMVSIEASIPPPWPRVAAREELDARPAR